jgi:chromosome segregation ATPase
MSSPERRVGGGGDHHGTMDEKQLRAAENEVRRKERELQLRETAVKARTLELDAFKRACDALSHDLNEKQKKLNEIEQTHGILVERDITLQERETEMAETESGVKCRIDAISRLERDTVSTTKKAQIQLEQKMNQMEKRSVTLDQKALDLERLEGELKQRRKAFQNEMDQTNARMAEREESMRRLEAHVRGQFLVVERRQAELTSENEDLHDRLKVMRAERAV